MVQGFIIAGTDTGVGKTVCSAMLMRALDAEYIKPIQSGIEDKVDTRIVQELSESPADRFHPEHYVFTEALSPHRAAELDRVQLDVEVLKLPQTERLLLVEAAGGLMVPLTRNNLQINVFKNWGLPVILCARTTLGTINHTLLSLEALWSRNISVQGLIFIGPENKDNIKTIAEFSETKILGHVPVVPHLDPYVLEGVFARNFDIRDFAV